MYYKIYKDNKILDALYGPIYFKRNSIGKPVASLKQDAEGVLSSNQSCKWFVESWLKSNYNGATCSIVEITENEYNLLRQALDQQAKDTSPSLNEPNVTIDIATSETIQESKINIMNKSCSEKIIEGIDIELNDGQKYHFDLTIEDQINLLSLQTLVDAGLDNIPYHAKGMEAKLFSNLDMQCILRAVNKHRLYHLTYFNALKSYINQLTDLNQLANIYYGIEIPEEYQTEAFKSLLK